MVFCVWGAVSAVSGGAPEDAPTDADGPTGRPTTSRRHSRLPDGRYHPDYRILTQSEMIATNTPYINAFRFNLYRTIGEGLLFYTSLRKLSYTRAQSDADANADDIRWDGTPAGGNWCKFNYSLALNTDYLYKQVKLPGLSLLSVFYDYRNRFFKDKKRQELN